MCQTRNSVRVKIGDRTPRIDGCMSELIGPLNRAGVKTLACCCGHGKYPATIIIINSEGVITEFYTGRTIPRTRRFYRRDNEGYYYIPELWQKESELEEPA